MFRRFQKKITFETLSANFFFHPAFMGALVMLHDMDREEQREYQYYRLECLLRQAYRAVPYWRKVVGSNLSVGASFDVKQFEGLPILTRDILRVRHREFFINGWQQHKYRTFITSGSTGTPKKFIADKVFCQKIMAAEEFYINLFGVKNYREYGYLLYKPHLKDLTSQIGNGQTSAEEVGAFFIKNNIRAAGGSLFRLLGLAEMVEAGELRVNLKFLVCGSQVLTEDTKRYLESVFHCPVYNKYVCAETGMMGIECADRGGFHIDPANFYLEIVDDKGAPVAVGKSGRILITIFNNRLMPLIRYELGDTGRWETGRGECRCGLQTPRLSFDGRILDYLEFAGGKKLSALALVQAVDRKFTNIMMKRMVIQESKSKILFQYVPGGISQPQHKPQHKSDIHNLITRYLQLRGFNNINVEVEAVPLLDNVRNEKQIYFQSQIASQTTS
ncbi:MAG: hypothetical protein AAB869_04625 [Patescibacteria group bacterium]